jgi:crotonobetainyl-CoA:carnitine CoA-transferase CaiB-like acyl-CoA transferase
VNATKGPLDGVFVADFSRVLAGPYASMLLGDLGATVVKIERPTLGDDTRQWGPPFNADGVATYFAGINRNKLSIALDLKDSSDLSVAKQLAKKADVVIENFQAGATKAFGLTYEDVAKQNPKIIYCSITGFGTSEGADWPGYDLLVQAMGGLMSITGDEQPTKVGVAIVDVVTGLHALVGILAALYSRDKSGQGQLVEVNLLTSLLSGLVNQSAAYSQAGVVAGRMGNAHPSITPYEVYQASDRPLVLAVGNDTQFAKLVNALGRPDLITDVRFATNPDRVANRSELNAILNHVFATDTAEQWGEVLAAAKVPCGPINDLAQAFALAERLGLKPLRQSQAPTGQSQKEVASPIAFSQSKVTYRRPAPGLDADRDEVLRLLDTMGN